MLLNTTFLNGSSGEACIYIDQGLYSQRFLFLELVLFLEFFLELLFS